MFNSSLQAENLNSINSIVCLKVKQVLTVLRQFSAVVVLLPSHPLESYIFICGCEAAQFHHIVIAVPPLNALDVTDAKT